MKCETLMPGVVFTLLTRSDKEKKKQKITEKAFDTNDAAVMARRGQNRMPANELMFMKFSLCRCVDSRTDVDGAQCTHRRVASCKFSNCCVPDISRRKISMQRCQHTHRIPSEINCTNNFCFRLSFAKHLSQCGMGCELPEYFFFVSQKCLQTASTRFAPLRT